MMTTTVKGEPNKSTFLIHVLKYFTAQFDVKKKSVSTDLISGLIRGNRLVKLKVKCGEENP